MKPGMSVPAVTLARYDGDQILEIRIDELVRKHRAAIVGVVGAFTPVCTREHVPKFVSGAEYLRSLGFDLIVCVAPNDPWTLKLWADEVDPDGRVTFLADGNLELSRKLRVNFDGAYMHLGERSRRYLMLTRDGLIERLTAEPSPTTLTCTRVEDVARPMAA